MKSIKCVVVGDGAVGKTSLLISYARNVFIEEHVPTIFDEYATTIQIGDTLCNLCLFDTAGQEDYDRLRPIAYPGTSVFIVCFSIDNPASHSNVKEKWIPEILHYCPKTPFLLVGTKSDLRNDANIVNKLKREHKSPVSHKEGEKLAREIRASKYIECSARTKYNVKDVFDEAIMIALNPSSKEFNNNNNKKPKSCRFL